MKKIVPLLCYLALFIPTISSAQVTTDGSLGGEKTTLAGNFFIPQTLGKTIGGNLFHSFSRFNLNANETATFTGDAGLKNVISRVTGGQASFINGTLTSTIGTANFYFINPAGVTFGANARVDVPAAFHVSTADKLQFFDGSVFSATQFTADSQLGITEPMQFGFLANQAGDIKIQGSQLAFAEGSQVSLSGNNLILTDGHLSSPAGQIELYATGNNAATVAINQPAPEALAGNITLNNASSVEVSGSDVGKILLRAGNIALHKESYLAANNNYKQNASLEKGIDIAAHAMQVNDSFVVVDANHEGNAATLNIKLDGDLAVVNGSQLISNSYGQGRAGQVTIDAHDIKVDGQAINYATIASDTDKEARGDAGAVTIHANQVTVTNGGQISTNSNSYGNAGAVNLNAETITVNGGKTGYALILSDTYKSNAHAGLLNITADKLNVINGGQISTNTKDQARGNAGSIQIKANKLLIDGQENGYAQITSDTYNAGGHAGTLSLAGKDAFAGEQLSIIRGGMISSKSESEGNSGRIHIDFAKVLIDGRGAGFAGILTDTFANTQAHAEDIILNADTLTLLDGAQIGSNTRSQGNAGNIRIHTRDLLIDGKSTGFAGILSNAFASSGNAGMIDVHASHQATLINNGQISSGTAAQGEGGDVMLSAPDIHIANAGIYATADDTSNGQTGNITVTASHQLALTEQSKISIQNYATVAHSADTDAGVITLSASNVALTDSSVTAESYGNVDAGQIIGTVAQQLTMDNAFITTSANLGNGGNITLNGGTLINLHNAGFFTSVTGATGNGGDINVASHSLLMNNGAIQANAIAGSGGDINLNLKALLASQNELILGGQTVEWQPFVSGLNIIQAASEAGVNGAINVTSPQFDISASISGLDSETLLMPSIDNNLCDNTALLDSSLARSGEGGLPSNEAREGFIPPVSVTAENAVPLTGLQNAPSKSKESLPCASVLPAN